MSKVDLENFVKECFEGDNEISFTISERGNQRIEIKDLSTSEVWQTLEDTSPPDKSDDFDSISAALILGLMKQI